MWTALTVGKILKSMNAFSTIEFMRLSLVGLLVLSCWAFFPGLGFGEEGVEVASQPDLEQGKKIYETHCLECHGETGHGDGPRAVLLAPRPGNLVSAAISSKTDEELLVSITEGVPRTSMEGWKDRLSNDERRNVLGYIRSLVHFHHLSPP